MSMALVPYKRKALDIDPDEKPTQTTAKRHHADGKTTAAEKVFAVPELVEKVLDLPATQLFALRRINSTFNDTVNLQKFKQTMFLEPVPKLRLFHLTKFLNTQNLPTYTHPFRIIGIYTSPGSWDKPGLKVNLQLRLKGDWFDTKRNRQSDHKKQFFAGMLACKQKASWQDVWICPGQGSLRIHLGEYTVFSYAKAQCVKLGDVIMKAMQKVEEMVANGKWYELNCMRKR